MTRRAAALQARTEGKHLGSFLYVSSRFACLRIQTQMGSFLSRRCYKDLHVIPFHSTLCMCRVHGPVYGISMIHTTYVLEPCAAHSIKEDLKKAEIEKKKTESLFLIFSALACYWTRLITSSPSSTPCVLEPSLQHGSHSVTHSTVAEINRSSGSSERKKARRLYRKRGSSIPGASATLRETLGVRMMKDRFNFSIQPLSTVQLEFYQYVRLSIWGNFVWLKSWQKNLKKNQMRDSFRLHKHVILW